MIFSSDKFKRMLSSLAWGLLGRPDLVRKYQTTMTFRPQDQVRERFLIFFSEKGLGGGQSVKKNFFSEERKQKNLLYERVNKT